MTTRQRGWYDAQIKRPAQVRVPGFVVRALFWCAKHRWFGFMGAHKIGDRLVVFTKDETIVFAKT